MPNAVTQPAPAVTDLRSLLSSVGFDASRRDIPTTLVIDKFDHWMNPVGAAISPTTLPCRSEHTTLP